MSLGAANLTLTAANLAELKQILPKGAAAGERYNREQMAKLDGDRR